MPNSQKLDTPLLVCIYLRGAADGLSLCVPHFEDRYYALRPTLGVPRPDDQRAAVKERAIDLDGRFGLHPKLGRLLSMYQSKELAIVHAAGSDDQTRSHFEAQDRMEHAGSKEEPAGGGFLARHLGSRLSAHPGSLRAIAMGTSAPESLRGAPVAVLQSANDYRLGPTEDAAFVDSLRRLYASDKATSLSFDGDLRDAGREALSTLDRLRALDAEPPRKSNYPDGALGNGLKEIARLARANIGVEVACIDADGWDTHFVQSQLLPNLAQSLGDALSSFRDDLGDLMDDIVVVCMTEFGRRAYENASLGTDHGRGGVMLVMGGGVRGGRVVTDWPGLAEEKLEPPGDLRVTIDYREILSEIVSVRLANPNVAQVFPGLTARSWGLFG